MKIGSFRGIGVYIHWTFWLLMLVYLLPVVVQEGLLAAFSAMVLIAGVFASVVAHEFGHAWAASWYGIRTEDITLLPIGGVARLQRLPDKPWQEIVIALAGPAVNLVIMAVLLVLMLAGLTLGNRVPGLEENLGGFLPLWLYANLILFGFNLLPAFPMDGGRVLRGLLATQMTHLRATQIAARVGRWMALLFAIMAILYGLWTLLLVAGFIFIAGTAELLNARFRELSLQGQGPDASGRAPFGFNTHGYARVWPTEQTYAPGEHPARWDDPEIVDAVEVKRLPDD